MTDYRNGNMPHGAHEYELWDAAYVLGALTESDRAEFEAHMAGCMSCQEAVAELVAVAPLLALAGDDAPVPPCPELLPSLLAKADQRLAAASESMQLVAAPTVDAQTVFPVFRTGNYAPVHDELTEFDLPVEGSIPAELNGWYLRNGPNPRSGQGHWCVGDGMVHGVRLENGRAAWYRNRWVRTESFERPVPLYNDDGSRNLHSSIANTHVVRHAGKTLALMEFSLPYEISN
ncbi:MAG: hypothetical protein QOC88_197, partial [Mycobacterium sp.]|nr:hypothetical protein [Mycobacterium sp.]